MLSHTLLMLLSLLLDLEEPPYGGYLGAGGRAGGGGALWYSKGGETGRP
jgi:hypothetical protein